eukprot:scaffold238520_cov24-Tisochrysis_lutea.AAC.1
MPHDAFTRSYPSSIHSLPVMPHGDFTCSHPSSIHSLPVMPNDVMVYCTSCGKYTGALPSC